MKLQTQIPLTRQLHNQINYDSKLLLIGSCFSENIGEKFEYFKFQSIVNPFGILFHPLAIEKLITRSINKDYYSEQDLYFQNEQWCCFDAHSKLNSASKEELLSRLNTQIDEIHRQLANTSHIVITLGTSWVYRHVTSDTIVANCHKLPQKQFAKELLSVDQITESLDAIISLVRSINPKANFLFTVSPVRHIKDGFVENTQSKSHLISAIHNVIEPRKQHYYFPSYEIMMDELRDYRFYTQDMIHPNQIAIDYIWEKFKSVWVSDEIESTMQDVDTAQKGLKHKPFNTKSEAHQKFITKLQSHIKDLCKKYPHFNFD
ncbi:GSCFA domain-containing protein [uncultured Winogradskyella sp.]|uniref:GSCFA domain-containing protein n=1 Tax=uncultured Winogradskyella sp. TaxID=395353 RepID=UPI002633123C|nr:GSCFA domain-containing protein [uncultured Winogradskyella sp.]